MISANVFQNDDWILWNFPFNVWISANKKQILKLSLFGIAKINNFFWFILLLTYLSRFYKTERRLVLSCRHVSTRIFLLVPRKYRISALLFFANVIWPAVCSNCIREFRVHLRGCKQFWKTYAMQSVTGRSSTNSRLPDQADDKNDPSLLDSAICLYELVQLATSQIGDINVVWAIWAKLFFFLVPIGKKMQGEQQISSTSRSATDQIRIYLHRPRRLCSNHSTSLTIAHYWNQGFEENCTLCELRTKNNLSWGVNYY